MCTKTAKQQPREWKKMLASHVSAKELIFSIYKELLKLNFQKKKKNTPKTFREAQSSGSSLGGSEAASQVACHQS